MGRQILLIDESAMLRRIAASVLHAQPARYEVVAATRASEGFARACGGGATVILADERIAGTADGGLCRRLLDEPRTSDVPVVLLTSRHGESRPLGTFPPNVVDTLGKPFAPEQLASLVNTITNLARKGVSLGEMRLALHPASETPEPFPYTDQPLMPESRREIADVALASEPSIRAALQAVIADGQTGVLRFCPDGQIPTEVFVDAGHLVVVTTRDGAAYSHDAAAVLPAKVSPATLHEGAEGQGRTGVPFLLTLGARGLISKAAAVELLQRFGQRHFARLWTLPRRSLHIGFERLEALPGFALRLEPMCESVDEWLHGSLRFLDIEDTADEARHQGLVGTPVLQRRGEAILKPLILDESEREFIRRITGRNDLPTIAKSLGITPENAFLLLYRFRCLEALDYRPAPLPFVVTPRTNLRRVLPLKR